MHPLDNTSAPERKLKLLAPFYNAYNGEQFIGSVVPSECGWLALDTDNEPFAVCRTRSEAAIMLQKNNFH